MEIVKRINNNVVLSEEDGREVILIGKGLGFQVNPGDYIDFEKIEKRYYPENNMTIDQMLILMTKATEDEIVAIYKIIRIFREEVTSEFNQNLLFTLMDHILYAIQRQKQGITLVNPIHWEIKKIYMKEYAVGVKAVEIIRENLYSNFSDEEAAFITLHFVNAQLQNEVDQNAFEHTELTNNILKIVRYSMNIEFDENSSYFQRFVTHIRYYLIRQSQQVNEQVTNTSMIGLAFSSYPKEKEAAEYIKEYLYNQKKWKVNDMELMYLIMHIGNLVAHSKIE